MRKKKAYAHKQSTLQLILKSLKQDMICFMKICVKGFFYKHFILSDYRIYYGISK